MEIGIFCGTDLNLQLQRQLWQLGYSLAIEGVTMDSANCLQAQKCNLLFIAGTIDESALGKNQLVVWVYTSKHDLLNVQDRDGIFFYLDLSTPDPICRQNLRLILSSASALQEHRQLLPIAQQLQGMVNQSLEQLQKLKKFSEKIVPLRHEFHGPISIFFKYGAGAKIGGDFYDLVAKKHVLYLFLFHTKSYLVSSSIMTRISQWAGQPQALELAPLLAQMMPEIASYRSGPQDPIAQVECIALAINLKTLAFQGHVFGKMRFIFPHDMSAFNGNDYPFSEPFLASAQIQGTFTSNSSLTILSPGVLANSGDDWPAIADIAQKYQGASERDYCNEFFIAMSRYKVNDFYQNDASVVLLKVDKHALFEI